jgi:hypothetical protein
VYVYRRDRPNCKRGGGVCFFRLQIIDDCLFLFLSGIVAVDVTVGEYEYCMVYVHRPPSSDIGYALKLCECIDHLCADNVPISICGDFNFPFIDWHCIPVNANSSE